MIYISQRFALLSSLSVVQIWRTELTTAKLSLELVLWKVGVHNTEWLLYDDITLVPSFSLCLMMWYHVGAMLLIVADDITLVPCFSLCLTISHWWYNVTNTETVCKIKKILSFETQRHDFSLNWIPYYRFWPFLPHKYQLVVLLAKTHIFLIQG